MCLAVYFGTDQPVQEVSWNKDRPTFYVEEVNASEPARKQFSGKYVYYAGSHQGCGCGFSKDGEPPEELASCQANYNALAAVLRTAIQHGSKVQVFTCWEGDQTDEPESERSVTVRALTEPSFELQQLELLNVASDA
jgi:hypothetical protein